MLLVIKTMNDYNELSTNELATTQMIKNKHYLLTLLDFEQGLT